MRLPILTSALALIAAAPTLAETSFNRVASFPTTANMADGEDRSRPTSAEIIAVTEDGLTAIYSDSPLGAIGLVDLTDARAPKPLGSISMDGEPTTTVIIGGTAFVGVNTSASFTEPSGALRTVDITRKTVTDSCDLGGQPDSVARAPDGSFIAVAIENERDEEVNDGDLPQMPAGFVVKLPVKDGAVDCAAKQVIAMTGLAEIAGDDPEPEFLDINGLGEIVVTLQENNHIVVIEADGAVASHFSAGSVDLTGIDTKTDGRVDPTGDQPGRAREPDAVKWIDDSHFATANEGDWKGGSRGFTIWAKDGSVVYDSGNSFEAAITAIGHYPEKRSKSKGVEPEGLAFARFGDQPLLFVASERGSVVGVYDVTDPAAPELLQLLPSGIGPEGLVAIPSRNLFVTANETDLGADGAARAHVMVYERQDGAPTYPHLIADQGITWGALSGLTADPEKPGLLYAVTDSAYDMNPQILTIDATAKPARITGAMTVTRNGQPAQKLDLEGITTDGKGGFWLATEGNSAKLFPHGILNVNAKGEIKAEIGLPAEWLKGETRFGLEGIARDGDMLWMAVQREWADDAKGHVKLMRFDTSAKDDAWTAIAYPLEPKGDGWIGLSEIQIAGGTAYVIERDNLVGDLAKLKAIYTVDLAAVTPAKPGEPLPVVSKTLLRDLIPDLKATGGYVLDKVEGFAIDAAGEGWVVTDNDGVDDHSGETMFWSIGPVTK
ncbi:esterase-like activity of phytase family protein [Paracoccus sp. p4-l81]|uniref:esterase-like activity of phytase family protein n=1 Tax=Paracoccus sp. p4-l81 TaxID=3342806 RepID=UPI0035BA3CE1